jgi:moderate conductance mechanosensitive channel
MLLHDLLDNPFIQSSIVIVAVSPVRVIGNRVIERLVRRLVKAERYETKVDERKREDTIINMFRALSMVVIWALVILIILTIFKVNIGALIAGAGVFGVVFGLGAQSTIKDYLAGVYILMENQYRVGDIVTLSGGLTGKGTSGVVEEITLRITALRDQDGTLNIVRNGDASVITNRTFKYSAVVINLPLTFDADINLVEKLVNETGKDMLRDVHWNSLITEPVSFLRIEAFSDIGVEAKVIGKVKPAAQWDVAGEFRRRITEEFKKHNIVFATITPAPAGSGIRRAAAKKEAA